MKKQTGNVRNSTYRATPNRINVGTHPMPAVRRGASSSSDYSDMQQGNDYKSVDYNSNQTRRSMNGTTGAANRSNFTPSRSQGLPSNSSSRSQGLPSNSSSRFQTKKINTSQSGPIVRQSRQPKFVFCYICGRQFTDASLPIHEPQCMHKWEVQNSLLPPAERRPRPKKPEILTGGRANGMTREELQEAQWEAAQANLVPCRNCGRRFAQDRIGVHERICKGLKNGPAPAASVQFDETSSKEVGGTGNRNKMMTQSSPGANSTKQGGGGVRQSRQPKFVFCYICGRQFTDASLPIHEPQCMQKWEVQNNQLPPSERRPRPKKPEILGKTSGMSREQLQEAQWQAAKANLVECKNCGRRFATDRIGVHERICKGLKHGPPPGVGAGSTRNDYDGDNDPRISGSPTKSVTFARPQGARDQEPTSSSYQAPSKPRTVVCYLCGREFGSKSIDIHQPQCLQKWHIENEKLPPHQRRQEPVKPTAMPISGRGGGYDLTAMNEAAMQTAMDSRVACSVCGRKFNPDRVAVHERSCRPK